jgi:hypothetical protein
MDVTQEYIDVQMIRENLDDIPDCPRRRSSAFYLLELANALEMWRGPSRCIELSTSSSLQAASLPILDSVSTRLPPTV